jgi:hypothetical protein
LVNAKTDWESIEETVAGTQKVLMIRSSGLPCQGLKFMYYTYGFLIVTVAQSEEVDLSK